MEMNSRMQKQLEHLLCLFLLAMAGKSLLHPFMSFLIAFFGVHRALGSGHDVGISIRGANDHKLTLFQYSLASRA